jgi:hypothetical protein
LDNNRPGVVFIHNFACSFLWAWSLFSDIKGRTQRVFENRVPRKTFGLKRDDIITPSK